MALSRRTDGTIGNCCCGGCPAPTCSNCSTPPICPPKVTLTGNDSQFEFYKWDLSADGWPSTQWPNVGCIDFSVFNSENDNFYIINYTSQSDFAAQLELALETDYGGNWTVNTTSHSGGFIVISITATEADLNPGIGTPEFIFADCVGNDQSSHFVSGVQSENCAYMLEQSTIITTGLEIQPDGACQYLYSGTLGGVCNLTLDITVNLNATNITAVFQLKDGETVMSDATFTSAPLVNPYDCDVSIPLTYTTSNNNGIIKWDAYGATFVGV